MSSPSSVEAAVLCACMIDPESLHKIPHLRGKHFKSTEYAGIFRLMCQLMDRGERLDAVTLMDAGADPDDIADILDATPTAAHIEFHAHRVIVAWGQRVSYQGGNDWLDQVKAAIHEIERATPGVETMTWKDIRALDPLQWMVEDLMPTGGVSLLVGHPKAGKSTLARVLAAEVLGHGEGLFLGRQVNLTGPVLYYCRDEHAVVLREHFVGILPERDDIALDVVQRGTISTLGRIVEDGRHKLLIVDTLGRLFAEERFPDGDSYQAWQRHLDAVRQLSNDTGCHVCLLHHARKSGGERSLSVLGSAAIAGAADAVIQITTQQVKETHVRYVESINRAGTEIPKTKLALAGDGWLAVDEGNTLQDDAYVMREEGMSIRQIAEQLGVGKSTVSRWLS